MGAWSRQLAIPPGPVVVVAVVEGGGGRGDGGIDSAHHDPGVLSLDGTEMGGALLADAGARADAVTSSKSHFLCKKQNTITPSPVNINFINIHALFTIDECTCPPLFSILLTHVHTS